MFKSNTQKKLSQIVFMIYLLLLTWLVLFKLSFNIAALAGERTINLIPFRESFLPGGRFNTPEVVYNILVFVPLGVYVHIFGGRLNFGYKLLFPLGLSVFYEAVQFIFAIGVTDITDVLGNTLGGAAGILLCMLLTRLLKEKAVGLVNGLGIAAEVMFLTLFALLVI